MKERAEQRSRRRLERLNGGMYHFGGMVVFQHVVKVLETLDNSSLVVVVSELARMYSLIVLVQGSSHVRVRMLYSCQTPDGTQTWP